MQHVIASNPAPDDFVFVPEPNVSEDSVGKYVENVTKKLQEAMDDEPLVVETDTDWSRAFALIRKGMKDTGTVVIDARKNPKRKMYTTMTIGTLDGTVAVISVRRLEQNMGISFAELLKTQLSDLRGLLMNLSVFKLVHDRDRWIEFVEQYGLPHPLAQPVVQVDALYHSGAAQGVGRLPSHFRTDYPDFVYQGLAWKYTGVSSHPVSQHNWDQVYPSHKRPPFARTEVMFDWPDEKNDFALKSKQYEFIKRTHLGISAFVWQLSEHRTLVPNQRQKLPYLPQVVKGTIRQSVTPDQVTPMGAPCIVEYVMDEAEGFDGLRETNTFKEIAADYFGVREPEDDPWIGPPYRYTGEDSSLDIDTAYPNWRLGRCERDMVHHWSFDDMCELGLQIEAGTVDKSKIRCIICLHWNHIELACPKIHTRCDKCGRMGHRAKECDLKTEEQHFLDFVRHVLLGFWTALNPGGVLHGPMGFGSGLTFTMTWQYHWLIQDVNTKMMLRRQSADHQILTEFRIACRNMPGRYHQYLRWQIYSDWKRGIDPRPPIHTRHRKKIEGPTPLDSPDSGNEPTKAGSTKEEEENEGIQSPASKRRKVLIKPDSQIVASKSVVSPQPKKLKSALKQKSTDKDFVESSPSTSKAVTFAPTDDEEDLLCLQLTPSEMEDFGEEFKAEIEETESMIPIVDQEEREVSFGRRRRVGADRDLDVNDPRDFVEWTQKFVDDREHVMYLRRRREVHAELLERVKNKGQDLRHRLNEKRRGLDDDSGSKKGKGRGKRSRR